MTDPSAFAPAPTRDGRRDEIHKEHKYNTVSHQLHAYAECQAGTTHHAPGSSAVLVRTSTWYLGTSTGTGTEDEEARGAQRARASTATRYSTVPGYLYR